MDEATIPAATDAVIPSGAPAELALPVEPGFSFGNLDAALAKMEEQSGKRPGGPTGECWRVVAGSLIPAEHLDFGPNRTDLIRRREQEEAERELGIFRVPLARVGGRFGSVDLKGRGYTDGDGYTAATMAETFGRVFGDQKSAEVPERFLSIFVSGYAVFLDGSGQEQPEGRHIIEFVDTPSGLAAVDSLLPDARVVFEGTREEQAARMAEYMLDRYPDRVNGMGVDMYYATDRAAYEGETAKRVGSAAVEVSKGLVKTD